MYSLLVDDSSDHKKSKGVNRIIVEKITMNINMFYQIKMFESFDE